VLEGARVHGLDGGSSKALGMPEQQAAAGRWGFRRPRARQQVVDRPGMESTGQGRATRCWRRETSGGWPASAAHVRRAWSPVVPSRTGTGRW